MFRNYRIILTEYLIIMASDRNARALGTRLYEKILAPDKKREHGKAVSTGDARREIDVARPARERFGSCRVEPFAGIGDRKLAITFGFQQNPPDRSSGWGISVARYVLEHFADNACGGFVVEALAEQRRKSAAAVGEMLAVDVFGVGQHIHGLPS